MTADARECLYADVADGNCALRATAESPPPEAVQVKALIAEREQLRDRLISLVSCISSEPRLFRWRDGMIEMCELDGEWSLIPGWDE